MNEEYNITAFSTALFSTWINIEELHLLLDAGDGISSGLLQKARKVKHVFISHSDRDHMNGLHQFIQLNARKDFPVIHYPKDSTSFPAMAKFLSNFDPHTKDVNWEAIQDGDILKIKKGIEVLAFRNEHIAVPKGIHKSLCYKIYETKTKLKSEYKNLNSDRIVEIAAQKGSGYISDVVKNNIIGYSGDTPVDNYEKWNQTNVLIHESTFIQGNQIEPVSKHVGKHSSLEEVMQMVSEIEIQKLILTHFSARYSKKYIDDSIRKLSKSLKIQVPIYAVYPGEIVRDILKQNPVN